MIIRDELLVNTHPITLDFFKEHYRPLCNEVAPIPLLNEELGFIIFDWREFDKIQGYLRLNKIWSVFEFENEDGLEYIIRPGLFQDRNVLKGYIISTVPYTRNRVEVLIL